MCCGIHHVQPFSTAPLTPPGDKALQSDSTSGDSTDETAHDGARVECDKKCKKRQLTFSCPLEDDLRNYAYEGDESSPGSLSSCKWTRRARNRRQLNQEVYRIISSKKKQVK